MHPVTVGRKLMSGQQFSANNATLTGEALRIFFTGVRGSKSLEGTPGSVVLLQISFARKYLDDT
jgi:hypothetical protein